MEVDSPYSELKSSFATVSIKALNCSSRLKLAINLDHKQPLLSDAGYSRDYRGLAELIGFQFHAIKRFEESKDHTLEILELWETRQHATLDKLIDYLELMGRHDVIDELSPSLKRDADNYLKEQRSLESPIQVPEVSSGPTTSWELRNELITQHDKRSGGCTIYDAYVSYAEEDTPIAREFASVLESSPYNLKLCMTGRDMLAGCPELNTNIELIKNRCRHMLIILTPNFMNSPALNFQVSFAGTLAIEQKQRILIPVILATCEIPPILNTVSKIDFTKEYTHDWMMDKLVTSLQPEDRIFLSSNAKITRGDVPNSTCAAPTESKPVRSFPPTVKLNLNSIHKPMPYSFGYTIKDKHGEQHREETGDGVGVVKGSYGFTDERGIHREVHYVADKAGFRAEVKTNEHGTAPLNPAAVKMISSAHPYLGGSGLGKIAAASCEAPALAPELVKAELAGYGGPLFGGAVQGYDSRFEVY